MIRSILLVLLLSMSFGAFADPQSDIDVAGVWELEDGMSRVQISSCDDASPCGAVSWVSSEVDADTDLNNPDPKLQNRSLIGVPILWGFKAKRARWVNGKVYDPGTGKNYKSHIATGEDGRLEVKGCVGPFCVTQHWTRVEAD